LPLRREPLRSSARGTGGEERSAQHKRLDGREGDGREGRRSQHKTWDEKEGGRGREGVGGRVVRPPEIDSATLFSKNVLFVKIDKNRNRKDGRYLPPFIPASNTSLVGEGMIPSSSSAMGEGREGTRSSRQKSVVGRARGRETEREGGRRRDPTAK